MTRYHCRHCRKTVLRPSTKAWLASFCYGTGKTVRLTRVKR